MVGNRVNLERERMGLLVGLLVEKERRGLVARRDETRDERESLVGKEREAGNLLEGNLLERKKRANALF